MTDGVARGRGRAVGCQGALVVSSLVLLEAP